MTAIAVVGPTASGKSDVAIAIAERYGGEVVSVDSMQVYRGMDIGTAKATPEMQAKTPHHLIDICEPSYDLAVAEFQQIGRQAIDDISERGATPVICGGSGLHFRALVDPLTFQPHDPAVREELEALDHDDASRRLLELDSEAGEHLDMANPRRVIRALEIALVTGVVPSVRAKSAEALAVRNYKPHIDFIAVGLDPGPELSDRVERRFDSMLESGLIEEVANLRPRFGKLSAQAVGYKEMLPVIDGDYDEETGRLNAIQATRALAKRQRTFFGRDPRIFWVPWHPDPAVRVDSALEYLSRQA